MSGSLNLSKSDFAKYHNVLNLLEQINFNEERPIKTKKSKKNEHEEQEECLLEESCHKKKSGGKQKNAQPKKLTAYNLFVQEMRKKGHTMSEISPLWNEFKKGQSNHQQE